MSPKKNLLDKANAAVEHNKEREAREANVEFRVFGRGVAVNLDGMNGVQLMFPPDKVDKNEIQTIAAIAQAHGMLLAGGAPGTTGDGTFNLVVGGKRSFGISIDPHVREVHDELYATDAHGEQKVAHIDDLRDVSREDAPTKLMAAFREMSKRTSVEISQ